MMKMKLVIAGFLAAAVFFLTIGCSVVSFQNGSNNPFSETGLNIENIVYTGSSNIFTYDILGIGPESASFNRYDLTESNCQIQNLAPGLWTVIVYARDFSGKVIASGYVRTNLESGKTTGVSIEITDTADAGTLMISMNWPEISSPVVSAVLTSSGYTDISLPIQMGADNRSAYFIDTQLPSRQYGLKMELLSGSNRIWSNTASIIVIKGEITYVHHQLSAGDVQTAPKGKYAVYSETDQAAERFLFDYNGSLYVWNNLNVSNSASPFEGNEAWIITASSGAWWGMGITHSPDKNLSGYAQGSLNVAIKTSSAAQFKIGIKNGSTEYWVNFSAGSEKFGLQRDGQWHNVAIPMYFFRGATLSNVNQLFMIAGDAPSSSVVMEIDNIYYDPAPSSFDKLNNVALGTIPNQSSTYSASYTPDRMADSNLSTLSCTTLEANPWLDMDLRSGKNVKYIILNTPYAMSNIHLFVSSTPMSSHDLNGTITQPGVTHYVLSNGDLERIIPVDKNIRYVRVQIDGTGYLEFAEIEVLSTDTATPEPALNNVALGTFPNQVNNYDTSANYVPGRAIDTNKTTYSDTKGSLKDPWWETDLRASKNISQIRLWMYPSGMDSVHVFVSDTPFSNNNITNTINQPGVTHYYFDSIGVCNTFPVGKSGRYVRVQYEGSGYMAIEEIEVLSTEAATPEPALNNVALGTFPNQVNNYDTSANYVPGRAIDTNKTTYSDTKGSLKDPWWETDLRASKNISQIRLWMYPSGMDSVHVFVSDTPFSNNNITNTINQPGVTHYYFDSIGVCKTIPVGKNGRYVRVQYEGNGYMAIEEIEVLSTEAATSEPALNNVALGTYPNHLNTYNDTTTYLPKNAIDTNYSTYSWTKSSMANPWWETDLRASKNISHMRLWMYSDGMQSVHVFVSDTPFSNNNITNTINQPGVTHYYLDSVGVCKTIPVGKNGRYVRVQYEGSGYMAIGEIEVLSSEATTPEPALNNVAAGTDPVQTNTYDATTNYLAKNAVDQNYSTYSWTKSSVANPWWETDLRASKDIDYIRMWMYYDGMQTVHVFVSDTPFNDHNITNTINQPGVTHYYLDSVGVCKTIPVGKNGRYVRVQYEGSGYMAMKEFEVFSTDPPTP